MKSMVRASHFVLFQKTCAFCLIALLFGTTETFAQNSSDKVQREQRIAKKPPLVQAVDRVCDSVVSIQGEKQPSLEMSPRKKTSDPSAKDAPKEVVTHIGMGAGVIIDERGYILTNNHVVKDLLKIQVITNDGTIYPEVEFIRNDVATDLALLKIEPSKPLKKIPLGNSDDVFLAEEVYAIGNPFGYHESVTRGIISALNRPLQSSDTVSYENVIQTDAAINPGNSGGPLINVEGKMIGLNAAVREDAQNIAFAIPVDVVVDVADRMIRQSIAKMSGHGLVFSTLFPDDSDYPFETDDKTYLKIDEVNPRSPAATAGLQKGDILLTSNKFDVHSQLDFTCSLIGVTLSDSVSMTVYRDGKKIDSSLAFCTLSQNPNEALAVRTNRPSSLTDQASPQQASNQQGSDQNSKMELAANTDAPSNLSGQEPNQTGLATANTLPSYGGSDENQHTSLVSETSNNSVSKDAAQPASDSDYDQKVLDVRNFFGIEVKEISLEAYLQLYPKLSVISIGDFNIIPSGGVKITQIDEKSLLRNSDGPLQVGDLIFGFVAGESEDDQLGITSLDHLYYLTHTWDEYKKPNQKVKFYLIRDGKPYFVEF